MYEWIAQKRFGLQFNDQWRPIVWVYVGIGSVGGA